MLSLHYGAIRHHLVLLLTMLVEEFSFLEHALVKAKIIQPLLSYLNFDYVFHLVKLQDMLEHIHFNPLFQLVFVKLNCVIQRLFRLDFTALLINKSVQVLVLLGAT